MVDPIMLIRITAQKMSRYSRRSLRLTGLSVAADPAVPVEPVPGWPAPAGAPVALVKFAPDSFAPLNWAPVSVAAVKSAPVSVAPLKLAFPACTSWSEAFERFAEERFALVRVA